MIRNLYDVNMSTIWSRISAGSRIPNSSRYLSLGRNRSCDLRNQFPHRSAQDHRPLLRFPVGMVFGLDQSARDAHRFGSLGDMYLCFCMGRRWCGCEHRSVGISSASISIWLGEVQAALNHTQLQRYKAGDLVMCDMVNAACDKD